MIACDRSLSRRLLDGDLSADEETAVLHHLDECPQCQHWLEQAAGAPDAWSTTRQLLSRSSECICWESTDGEASSETQPHIRTGASTPDPGRASHVDLSFLAPSDEPAYLGRVGTYEIVGVIGQGGMGVVLKAVDRSLSRFVAIKVLSPLLAGAGAARQRFAREARAMAALSHEHIVPIYAVDEHRSLPYFAMEYVPGGTLAARLAHEGPLEVVAAVRIAMQTARALHAAHDSGLVHRDIKPANILLDRGVERVRVTDFGLARVASEASDTASGMLAGTPQFMSPEQINRDACDARSDLFSLGSMMYAMCTGHAPFRADSVFAVLQRIVHEEPRRIREQNPSVPFWLEGFIARLMAKDCEARFQSAAEVAELLERELAHLQNPGLAPAPARPWLPRRRMFTDSSAHSSRAALIAAGIAAAALVVVAWRPWDVADPEEPASHGETAVVHDLQPATVPLWNADGADAVQRFAVALESQSFGQAPSPSADMWSSEVLDLQRRIGLLIEESSVPANTRRKP